MRRASACASISGFVDFVHFAIAAVSAGLPNRPIESSASATTGVTFDPGSVLLR